MIATDVFEKTLRSEQHTLSRTLAIRLYAAVEDLLANGADAHALHEDLMQRFLAYRERGQVIERDALVEVLDEMEEIYPT